MQRKLKIFLIEDATNIRSVLIEILHQSGDFHVIGYADGQVEALCQLRAVEWDVAIVDIGLREGTGLGVLAGLQNDAKLYGQRIVFTGNPSPALKSRILALGACELFDKSNDLNRLVSYMKNNRGAGLYSSEQQ